jgi:DNA repair exonuclease SbcCD ATPase subunit
MIEQIALTNFRGSTQPFALDFSPGKNITVIFGENGTGKSTIVDAVDFVCNGEFGSISNRSGPSAAKHLVSLDGDIAQLEVRLVYARQAWRARLRGRTVQVTPDNPPRALVLRRADISRLMEAAPAERYKALQRFITLPQIERTEAALRDATRSVGADVDDAQRRLEAATESLTTLWQHEGQPPPNALAWARARTREDSTALRSRVEALQNLRDAFRTTERLRSEAREHAEKSRRLKTELAQTQQAVTAEAGGPQAGDAELVRLLEEARRYLHGPHANAEHCPLCGKPETPAHLIQRIEETLARTTQLRKLLEQQSALQNRLDGIAAIQSATRMNYIDSCHTLAAHMEVAPPAFQRGADVGVLDAVTEDNDTLLAARDVLNGLAAAAPMLDAAIDDVQRSLAQLTALRTYVQSVDAATAVLREQEAVKERLGEYLQVVEAERKRYVDELMQQIGAQVNAFYAAIHPGEALGHASINVKSTGRASLDLQAQFASQEQITPSAYYSEGHLDTLGLCIYLAMAKNAGGNAPIIVLDDVLGTLDDIHLARVVDLLAAEAPHIGHLIITTPSRTWVNHMRDAGGGPHAELLILSEWDLARGIALQERAHSR